MRIVAGKFRGRNLAKSDHLKSLRPTTDKNREALFSILGSAKFLKEIDFKIEDAAILDVCCGSGAVAFEALSRGAKLAFLIDNSLTHLEIAKKNSQLLKVENDVEILFSDVKKLSKNEKFFDLIFIDPPYAEDYAAIIKNLLDKNWIQKKSLIVVEFDANNEPENFIFDGLKLLDLRRYGKTSFVFLAAF
jgi:16S rRNA (guanine966-N2)-methyltransferase